MPRVRSGYMQEYRGYFSAQKNGIPALGHGGQWTREQHRRYFVFTDKKGGRHRLEFPILREVDATRAWGQQEARRVMALLIQARQQIQAPAAFIAECMEVAPEVIYRLENTKRDVTLSGALRYARALGLEFDIVEKPT